MAISIVYNKDSDSACEVFSLPIYSACQLFKRLERTTRLHNQHAQEQVGQGGGGGLRGDCHPVRYFKPFILRIQIRNAKYYECSITG